MAAGPPVEPQPHEPAVAPQPGHLWDYVHVLLRRRRVAIAIAVAVVVLAVLQAFLTRPVYEATAQILIERNDPSVLTFKEVSQTDSQRDDYYQTQYKLLQSRSLAQRVIERLDLLADPEYGGPRDKAQVAAILAQPQGQSRDLEAAINNFLAQLSVRPVRNSRLVTVSVSSHRPELAAQATNALAQLYIQQSLDLRFQTSSEAGKWLGTQIDEQRRKVEQLDAQLQALKSEQGLVNVDERRTLLGQRLKELGTALNERKTERLQKEALWRQMVGAPNAEELPEVMRSGVVQSLRIELASLERQQAQLLERYLDQHPEVTKVRNQIGETRSKLRAEAQRVIRSAENDYKASAAQEASVSSALEAAKQETLALGQSAVGYDSRKQEVDAARKVLDDLMSRSKETDVASELKSTNIRIVDPASVPEAPIRPRRLRDIALGCVLALFLSAGAVFFLEYLDNTLKTPDDIRNQLGVPLLGVIPEQPLTSEAPQHLLSASLQGPFAEGYRVVRTALNFSWPDQGSRVVLVTSTAPGEGKTLTAVNVAVSLGSAGQKVLVIDADLRKPQAHALLRAQRTPGLSDVLVGNAKPSEVIQQRLTSVPFCFMPAGTTVPSPADLLTTHTMQGLVEGLRKFYDWIVIDTPPVGAVAEPLILAPLSDGVIVVAGAEMVPRKAVALTLERIADTGARILGVVLNRAQIEKHSYYYSHYYGHYYGRYEGRRPRPKSAGGPRPANVADKRASR